MTGCVADSATDVCRHVACFDAPISGSTFSSLVVPRSTPPYAPMPRGGDEALLLRMHELVLRHPRRGYRMLCGMLRLNRWRAKLKPVYELWRREGLMVPTKHRKRTRPGQSNPGDEFSARVQPHGGVRGPDGTMRCRGTASNDRRPEHNTTVLERRVPQPRPWAPDWLALRRGGKQFAGC